MKCDQSIKYKMRNIFLEKHIQKVLVNLVPYLFKRLRLSTSLDQQSEML